MPLRKSKKSRVIKEREEEQEEILDALTETITLRAGVRATLSAEFCSVGADFSAETTCKVENRDKVSEKLWDLVNYEANHQLEDAEASLRSFIQIKRGLEK